MFCPDAFTWRGRLGRAEYFPNSTISGPPRRRSVQAETALPTEPNGLILFYDNAIVVPLTKVLFERLTSFSVFCGSSTTIR